MFKKFYWYLVKGENSFRHILLLFMRLYWGVLLVITGIGKWMNLDGVAGYFADLHLPYPQLAAAIVATFETIGGISLVLGLLTRLFTIPLIVIFITAYATAHAEAVVGFFKNPSLFVTQDPFMFLLTALVVFSFGPGFFSIDYWMEKKAYGDAL